MGTNYYHQTDICPTCRRSDERHIGKSSCGWTFNFQAHPDIRSYREWLDMLAKGGVISDEYGRVMSLDVFREVVEKREGKLNNHALKYPGYGNFVDAEGHSFSDTEFS